MRQCQVEQRAGISGPRLKRPVSGDDHTREILCLVSSDHFGTRIGIVIRLNARRGDQRDE
jgi:hypothetical protein